MDGYDYRPSAHRVVVARRVSSYGAPADLLPAGPHAIHGVPSASACAGVVHDRWSLVLPPRRRPRLLAKWWADPIFQVEHPSKYRSIANYHIRGMAEASYSG